MHETECGPIDVVCTVCGKICPGRKNHTDHMRIHNQPAVHPCNFCGKKFRTGKIFSKNLPFLPLIRSHKGRKICEIFSLIG